MQAKTEASVAEDFGLVVDFPGAVETTVDEVGGKGFSLIHLCREGMPVPPGVILTSRFFGPWLAHVLSSPAWESLQSASPDDWPPLCEMLKQSAMRLSLNEHQADALTKVREKLDAYSANAQFAVRSSSPQEDLQGASFAGGYETKLGVRPTDLEDAVRECFASVFDFRVLAYKHARGIDASRPRMAVIIQCQVDSEVAGVAFSLNPLTNDHDELVVNAAWGQGESVVGGHVTPDQWVLNKVTGRVVEHAVNDKRTSRWLRPEGGLVERNDYRPKDACLSHDQLTELLDVVNRLETAFGFPVDVEWAIASGTLHVLQVRPVTGYVPLPHSLMTRPGERRRLYMDIALSSGLTTNAPISAMGLSIFSHLFANMGHRFFGRHRFHPSGGDELLLLEGSRMYMDLSNVLWLGGPRVMAKKLEMADASLARILETIDVRVYRSPKRPSWASLRMACRIPVAQWRLRRLLGNCLLPFVAPRRSHRRIREQLNRYEETLALQPDFALPLATYWDRHVAAHLQTLIDVSLAAVAPGVLAVKAFTRLARPLEPDDPNLIGALDRGFEGNVVVDMTVQMHALARLLDEVEAVSVEDLERRLSSRELPGAFLEAWDDFVGRFGCRGPTEMDVSHPRYGDEPGIALKQVLAMTADRATFDPAGASAHQVGRRRAAAATLIGRAGIFRRSVLRRLNLVTELFAGFRDTPKHHLLILLHHLRRRLVLEGERLSRDGRLDEPGQVFDLGMDTLIAAETDRALDLRRLRATDREYHDRLTAQAINFPALIDSRGRILRAPRTLGQNGAFQGVGLSAGVVTGRALTLRSPHEKALVKGEVLIAYTTDPGWTPIFVNAAAVVLEIGGSLQHGAVVAREFGLPCVAGIDGISTAVMDGQLVEVDGNAGTVRLLPDEGDDFSLDPAAPENASLALRKADTRPGTRPDATAWALPLIEPRVRLRAMVDADLDTFHAYRSDAEVARYQGWAPMSRSAAKEFIGSMRGVEGLVAGAWIQLAMARNADGRLLGDLGLCLSPDGTHVQVGYTCAPQFQRRGYTTEAVGRAVSEIWLTTNCECVFALVDPRNGPSIRLLDRLGFRTATPPHEDSTGSADADIRYELLRPQSERLVGTSHASTP